MYDLGRAWLCVTPYILCKGDIITRKTSIGTASANSVESDLGCTSMIYFDNVTLTLHSVTLTSQKPYQHNNKCDCRKANGCK